MCEEDLDFMEQINQELELETSAESQPEGLIKRSANLLLLLLLLLLSSLLLDIHVHCIL